MRFYLPPGVTFLARTFSPPASSLVCSISASSLTSLTATWRSLRIEQPNAQLRQPRAPQSDLSLVASLQSLSARFWGPLVDRAVDTPAIDDARYDFVKRQGSGPVTNSTPSVTSSSSTPPDSNTDTLPDSSSAPDTPTVQPPTSTPGDTSTPTPTPTDSDTDTDTPTPTPTDSTPPPSTPPSSDPTSCHNQQDHCSLPPRLGIPLLRQDRHRGLHHHGDRERIQRSHKPLVRPWHW